MIYLMAEPSLNILIFKFHLNYPLVYCFLTQIALLMIEK